MFGISQELILEISIIPVVGLLSWFAAKGIKYMFRRATLKNKDNYDKEEFELLMRISS